MQNRHTARAQRPSSHTHGASAARASTRGPPTLHADGLGDDVLAAWIRREVVVIWRGADASRWEVHDLVGKRVAVYYGPSGRELMRVPLPARAATPHGDH